MNRIFLAILALFAGIATQVSPADARVRGDTEIGAVLGQRAAVRAASLAEAAVSQQPEARVPELRLAASRPAAFAAPAVPTVRIGPDRARE